MTTRPDFDPSHDFARAMDADDPLAGLRDEFHIPRTVNGAESIYLTGNSLGLQPKAVRAAVDQELKDWADLGVDGHFNAKHPWYSYHEELRAPAARVVGALPSEVVVMNTLTTNLHLLMVSFYRPTRGRFKVLIEEHVFPSDLYAVWSQVRFHGFDPAEAIITMRPRGGEDAISTESIEEVLARHGEEIALVLFGGVNYYTGQAFDLQRITAAAHAHGCLVGFDLAHAAGNIPLQLHDWDVDFAAWCTYKYLNSGPGGVAGCFVHDRHGMAPELPRFAGWWGTDPATRFHMHPDFVPQRGAAGWQLSNAQILPMAAHRAALEQFDRIGMDRLRDKSEALTGYMEFLLDRALPEGAAIVTPREPAARGCQLSIRVGDDALRVTEALAYSGIVADYRRPDVVRVAPVPMYNTFDDVWRFVSTLRAILVPHGASASA